MARRRAAYQKRKQNKFAMMLVTLVLLMLILAVNIRKSELKEKQAAYAEKQQELQEKIDKEEARAKEKLGLVYEDEIVFKTEGE